MILSTNQKPRVAVIGCGQWGEKLAQSFFDLDVLAAVAGRTPKTLLDLEQRFSVPALSIPDAFAKVDIDAVVIATPASTHAALALEAIKAGKHVLLEKPAVISREELQALTHASSHSGKTFMVGHILRYHPDFEALVEIIQSGVLGPIRKIYVARTNQGKIREDEGVMLSVGPHALSMVLALTGRPPVSKRIVTHNILNLAMEDSASLHLEFENELSAEITLSWLYPVKRRELVVICEQGMAVFDEMQSPDKQLKIQIYSVLGQGADLELRVQSPTCLVQPNVQPLLRECEHFISCIMSEKQPRTGATQMYNVLDVLLQD